jgi:mono/diheme cytochrome c family protein
MKTTCRIISVICFVVLLTQCKTRQKIEYNIPKEIPEATRVIFLERCEKGKILFKINCSGCHGIFTKGKDGITNFTKDQIDSYRAVAQIGNDKKNHAVAAKMSAQQLDYILTFLSLRKDK